MPDKLKHRNNARKHNDYRVLVKDFLFYADTSVYHTDNFKELGMAIELIKNGAVNTTSPVKPHSKNGTNGKSFELTLSSETTKVVATGEPTTGADRVVLTNTFNEIKKNVNFSRESGVDMDKVARLKKAIENGTYEINPDRIAAKMMQYAI